MELKEIKALVNLMREHGLVELEIEDRKGKVRLVRANHARPADTSAGPQNRPVPQHSRAATKAPPQVAANELAENERFVTSPMVGTFYRSPSPGAATFVDTGDVVRKGQVLCIIEAMKMMNEIEADAAGKIVRFLCDNGQPVQYGQPLLVLQID